MRADSLSKLKSRVFQSSDECDWGVVRQSVELLRPILSRTTLLTRWFSRGIRMQCSRWSQSRYVVFPVSNLYDESAHLSLDVRIPLSVHLTWQIETSCNGQGLIRGAGIIYHYLLHPPVVVSIELICLFVLRDETEINKNTGADLI